MMSQRALVGISFFFPSKMRTAVSRCQLRRNVPFSSEVKTLRGEVEGGNRPTGRPEENSLRLTTMMAIRPPTSPTTVIGGFSLAIITAREQERRLSGDATAGTPCSPSATWSEAGLGSRLGKMGWENADLQRSAKTPKRDWIGFFDRVNLSRGVSERVTQHQPCELFFPPRQMSRETSPPIVPHLQPRD